MYLKNLFVIAFFIVTNGNKLKPIDFLVTIEFDNKQECVGAMVDRMNVATSLVCLERYNYAKRLYKNPCRVFAGISEDGDKTHAVKRFCLGYHKFNSKFFPIADTSIKEELYIPVIPIDIPFDSQVIKPIPIVHPNELDQKNRSCVVYGWSSESLKNILVFKRNVLVSNSKYGSEDAQVELNDTKNIKKENRSGDTYQSEPKEENEDTSDKDDADTNAEWKHLSYFETITPKNFELKLFSMPATIMNQEICAKSYSDRLGLKLPEKYICVVESGQRVQDLGRVLVCNGALAGVVANDRVVDEKNPNHLVYAYTSLKSNGKCLEYSYTVLIVLHIIYTILLF